MGWAQASFIGRSQKTVRFGLIGKNSSVYIAPFRRFAPIRARTPKDRWPSGLRRTPGTRVYVKAYRGFESLPVRHFPLKPLFFPSHTATIFAVIIDYGSSTQRARLYLPDSRRCWTCRWVSGSTTRIVHGRAEPLQPFVLMQFPAKALRAGVALILFENFRDARRCDRTSLTSVYRMPRSLGI